MDDLVVMLRLAKHGGFGFEERHAVLGEIAARGDQQVFVFRRRVEQRFVQLQPERDRIADQLEVVVSREHIAARRQGAGYHADGLALHERAAARQAQHTHQDGAPGSDRQHAG